MGPSITRCSTSQAMSSSVNRNASIASSSLAVPHTTPYRRPMGRWRVNTSNTHDVLACPDLSDELTIDSSY